jgi:hypothetical protein
MGKHAVQVLQYVRVPQARGSAHLTLDACRTLCGLPIPIGTSYWEGAVSHGWWRGPVCDECRAAVSK